MEDVWGKGNFRIKDIYDTQDKDLILSELKGDEYYDIQPTLYYAFGKADPDKQNHRFVLDDNDLMECIASKWLDNKYIPNLQSYIQDKKVLLVGCNLKDWCFRFF